MKKSLSAFLAALMLLSALASCAQDGGEQQSDTTPALTDAATTAPEETTPEDTGRASTKDSLPADLNFDGLPVHIHSFESEKYDIIGMEEDSGDVVYDAVYHRTLSVADRLNVEIEWADSVTTKWQDFSAELNSTILAGDDAWQIVYAMGNSTIQSNRGNLFMDLSDAKYLDYSQPWWWVEAMEEVSLDGKERKYLVGDLALSNYLRSGCYFFNKALHEDVFGDPDELYKTVIDGDWTYDKLAEMSAEAYQDVNGDGVVNEGDVYGVIIGNPEYLKHSEYGTDVQHYYRRDDGYPVIEYDLDRAQIAVEKIYSLLFETTGNMYQTEYLKNSVFSEGSLFFFPNQLLQAFSADLREMEDDYGIIPYPKLDENQEEYENLLHNSSNYVTIPITCEHPDEVGAVIEAMCAESYRSVVEVFYETALKTKYSRDSYSGQCIDIIRDVTKKNLAYEYDGQFGSGVLIATCVRNGGTNFSSLYAKSAATSNKVIEKTVAKLLKEKEAGN